MLKVHVAVEVQLVAYTCSIIASPVTKKLTLMGLNGFSFQRSIGEAPSYNYANQRWVKNKPLFLQCSLMVKGGCENYCWMGRKSWKLPFLILKVRFIMEGGYSNETNLC